MMQRYYSIDGEKLRLKAAQAGLSFRQLARKADLTAETITRICGKNGRRVSLLTLGKLAKALNIDLRELVKQG